jgi:hypothetical protein
VVSAHLFDHVPDEIVLAAAHLLHALDHNLVSSEAEVFFVVAVELPPSLNPFPVFLVEMIPRHKNGDGLVHTAMADHGSKKFLAMSSKRDEAGADRVAEVPDGGH